MTLPPASPVDLLTAYYSTSAQAYEQWWASAIHPAGVHLIDKVPLHSAERVLDLGAGVGCSPELGLTRPVAAASIDG